MHSQGATWKGDVQVLHVSPTFSLCVAAAIRLNPRAIMRLLDRYVLRNFLEPFLLCFCAFLGILLIFDINDNLSDFIAARERWRLIGIYYGHQFPQFILLCMPIALLLAILYCLSKMSRSNEVISMLTAGRSVLRIIAPLFAAATILTALCLGLNYKLAPQADALREIDLGRIRFGELAEYLNAIRGHLMKDRMTNRVWFATSMLPDVDQLDAVHITQLNEIGQPVKRWYAQNATYDPRTRTWRLNHGREITFDSSGDVEGTPEDWTRKFDASGSKVITGWSETPYRISSSRMEAEGLSVPELRQYLVSNSDFPVAELAPYHTHLLYRWALPFTCLAVVFIAAPLGIVYSRRAVLASVAGSIFIFFGFLFCMFFFLALGKGNHVPPVVAAWTPNALLAGIGTFLLYLRATNREMPRLLFR
jgi:lipopolysaccharide export system permease protein